jgi:hypothetical protein
VTSSPRSLLLTLIGWVATRAADRLTSARGLSLTGRAIATATIGFVYVTGSVFGGLQIRASAPSTWRARRVHRREPGGGDDHLVT